MAVGTKNVCLCVCVCVGVEGQVEQFTLSGNTILSLALCRIGV